MKSSRRITIIVGILFIIELVLYGIGSTFTEGLLDSTEYLNKLAANKNQIITGVLLESITAACLVFIGVLMYPFLKIYNKTLARSYFGIRVVETVITCGYLVIHFLLFALSKEYIDSEFHSASHFNTIGNLLKEGLAFIYEIHIIFYSIGCFLLFGAMFKLKIVPRIISILGLGATILMIVGLVFDMYGFNFPMEIYGSPIAVCQIILGFWLIIKGFNVTESEILSN